MKFFSGQCQPQYDFMQGPKDPMSLTLLNRSGRNEEFSEREESSLAIFLGMAAMEYSKKIIKIHHYINFYPADRGTKLIKGFC